MESNNDILNRIRLLMEYDMSMTLTENLVMVNEQNTYDLQRTGFQRVQRPDTTSRVIFDPIKGRQISTDRTTAQDLGYKSWVDFAKDHKISTKPGFLVKVSKYLYEVIYEDAVRSGKITKNFVINLSKGNIVSALQDARDFLMDTYSGAFVDIFVSVAGVEVGGPIIMEALEIGFLQIDLIRYTQNLKNFKYPEELKNANFKEKFIYKFLNFKDFERVVVDLVCILTRGLVRRAGSVLGYLEKNGAGVFKPIANILTGINEFLPKLGKLGEFLSQKMSSLTSFVNDFAKNFETNWTKKVIEKEARKMAQQATSMTIDRFLTLIKGHELDKRIVKNLLDNALKRVPSKLITATTQATFTYFITIGAVQLLSNWIKGNQDNPEAMLADPTTEEIEDFTFELIIKYNPDMNITDKKEIKVIKNGYINKYSRKSDLYIIKGEKYIISMSDYESLLSDTEISEDNKLKKIK